MNGFWIKLFFIVVIVGVVFPGCGSSSYPPPPYLISLSPSSGPPGTLVSIQFSGTVPAGSVADIGGSRGMLYDFGYQGQTIYTVIPPGAQPGAVDIRVLSHSASNSLNFSITSGLIPSIANTVDIPVTAIFKSTSSTLFYLYSFTSSDVFTLNSQDLTYAEQFSTGVDGDGRTFITPDGRYVIGAPYTSWFGPNYLLDVYDSTNNALVVITFGNDLNNFIVSNDNKRLYVYSDDVPDIVREYTLPDLNNITNMIPVPPSPGPCILSGISSGDTMLYFYTTIDGDFPNYSNYMWAMNITDPSLAMDFSIPVNEPAPVLISSPWLNFEPTPYMNTAEQSGGGSKIYVQGTGYDASNRGHNILSVMNITNETSQNIGIPDYINNKLEISPGGHYGYVDMAPQANLILVVPLTGTGGQIIALPYTSNFTPIYGSVFQALFSQDGSVFYQPAGDRLLIINTNGYN